MQITDVERDLIQLLEIKITKEMKPKFDKIFKAIGDVKDENNTFVSDLLTDITSELTDRAYILGREMEKLGIFNNEVAEFY